MKLGTILRTVPRTGLASIGDQLVLGCSHHDLLLLDRAVSDALGSESRAIRHRAAFDASLALVQSIASRVGVDGGADLIDLAVELFATLGLGQLSFELDATGGQAVGSELLFSRGYAERGDTTHAARWGIDTFVAGYAAAAASAAYPSDWGAFEADEITCNARGHSHCSFTLTRKAHGDRRAGALTRAEAEQLLSPGHGVDPAPSVVALAARELVGAFDPGERGEMRLGDARFALLPAAYRAQLEYDTLHLLDRRERVAGAGPGASGAELAALFVELASESARAGAFHLLGAIYESAPLRDKLGPVPDDPGERAEQLCSVASVLGWGELSVLEIVPDVRLALSVPLTPEAVYYAARHGGTPSSRLPGLRGVAEAIAWLAMLPELGRAPVNHATYLALCRGPLELSTRETRSLLSGDPDCELVVEMRSRV